MAVAQAKPESGIEDNYSVFGSYDFPLWTPRLRLNIYALKNEFDTAGGNGINFLGMGYEYGSILRFNAFQKDNWFFDLLGSVKHVKSKVTPSLFPEFFGSEVAIDLWSVGAELHHQDDMSGTSLSFDLSQSMGGSDQKKFWDPATLTGARTNAERDFSILTLSASHSQFLDQTKVHRILGTAKYIQPDERLVPVMMTIFGGMYTVRGYKESEIVADGGTLASVQYEYDFD